LGHFDEKYLADGLELCRRLIECKALEIIDGERLKHLARGGIVGFKCADGKYAGDIADHIRCFTDEPHFLSLNGTALLLLPDMEEFAEDRRVLYKHAREAWAELKKGTTIVPLTHFPCGKAHKHDISLVANLLRTYDAAADIARELGVDRRVVVPMIHIHWNVIETTNGNPYKHCRTYKIKISCNTEAPRLWQQLTQAA